MLRGIPSLLTPDALHALASMGHGDELAIVDANFPAASVAAAGRARLVSFPGICLSELTDAVLAIFPLDDFGPECAWTMQVVGDATTVPEAVKEVSGLLAQHHARATSLERFEFYHRAQATFAMFQCGDLRRYGNLLLRKGVIAND